MQRKSKNISKRNYPKLTLGLVVMSVAILMAVILMTKEKTIEPKSSRDYFMLERDFMLNHARLKDTGGFAYWVNKKGEVVDPRIFSIFQANVILWTGGIESQHPSEKNRQIIRSAADALIDHLYKGGGEWFEWVDEEVRVVQEFNWNPRSDAHIAYALLQAYRILGNENYLTAANETLEAQRTKSPTPPIMAEFGENLDLGFRFPQHLGHLEQSLLLNDPEGKNYADQIDNYYRGKFGKEPHENVPNSFAFLHGAAVLDKLMYAYLARNPEAVKEGISLYNGYTRQGHDDLMVFENNVGEAADNGRDYYDKRLSMGLVLWSQTLDPKYRNDAMNMWSESLRFWDYEEPYGFFVNLSQDRKTCFTINQPAMLMDLREPEIIEIKDHKKFWWNHQIEILAKDPNYNWLDHEMKGVGIDPKSVRFNIPFGFHYGGVRIKPGNCPDCVILEANYVTFKDGNISLSFADYFNNKRKDNFKTDTGMSLFSWSGLNWWSWMYYLTTFSLAILLFLLLYSKTRKWGAPKQKRKISSRPKKR